MRITVAARLIRRLSAACAVRIRNAARITRKKAFAILIAFSALFFVYFLLLAIDEPLEWNFRFVWLFLGLAAASLAVIAKKGESRTGAEAGWKRRLPRWFTSWGVKAAAVLAIAVPVSGLAFIAGKGPPGKAGAAYLIVLGGGINSDGSVRKALAGRLDSAIQYLNANEGTLCVVSGGIGVNKPRPESQAMKEYLVNRGIPERRVIEEDGSLTTVENLAFCREIILREEGRRGGNIDEAIVLVTSDFHIARSCFIAKKKGYLNISAIASRTALLNIPTAYFREILAVIKMIVLARA